MKTPLLLLCLLGLLAACTESSPPSSPIGPNWAKNGTLTYTYQSESKQIGFPFEGLKKLRSTTLPGKAEEPDTLRGSQKGDFLLEIAEDEVRSVFKDLIVQSQGFPFFDSIREQTLDYQIFERAQLIEGKIANRGTLLSVLFPTISKHLSVGETVEQKIYLPFNYNGSEIWITGTRSLTAVQIELPLVTYRLAYLADKPELPVGSDHIGTVRMEGSGLLTYHLQQGSYTRIEHDQLIDMDLAFPMPKMDQLPTPVDTMKMKSTTWTTYLLEKTDS